MRHTKIVCTVGPASSSPEVLTALIRAGMDVARLNFSHGEHDTHRAVIRRLRAIAAEAGKPLAILADLCGPKMRVGEMRPDITLHEGEPFTLTPEVVVGDEVRASISHVALARDVKPSDRVLLDDGLLELRVEAIAGDDVRCVVVVGGALGSRKGVNFPGVALSVPSVTEKDFRDLAFGLDEGVDYFALSFVRCAEDVAAVKARIRDRGRDTPVLVKIEKFEALERLESILQAADGAMVARGDLGVETAFERVPLEQKRIIRLCRGLARPVITATQMLDSMIRNPRPTRAEAADVANAVLDGTDAVMLSGETASGHYPLEAVQAMVRIVTAAEEVLPYAEVRRVDPTDESPANVLSLAACEMAERVGATVIVACTESGATARRVAQFRPRAPVLAVTSREESLRRLNLHWGVVPWRVAEALDLEDVETHARKAALASGLARSGDLTVIQADMRAEGVGARSLLLLDVAGEARLSGGPADPRGARASADGLR